MKNRQNQPDIENIESLDSQTAKLAAFILSGKKYHCKLPERTRMGIGVSNSRIFDLNKKFGLREFITSSVWREKNKNGSTANCKLYYIPFDQLQAAREHLKRHHPRFYEKVMYQLCA